jgi:hypothetical protein
MKIRLRLEDKCHLKTFVDKMIPPVNEKYQRCFECSGFEKERYCYVEPSKKLYEIK